MKQLFIANGNAYAASVSGGSFDEKDMTTLGVGSIVFTNLKDGSKLTEAADDDFAAYLGRGTNLVPLCMTDINYDSLDVVISSPRDAVAEVITVTPTADSILEGDSYTLVLSKKGVGFNERNNWTVEYVAKESDDVAAIIAGFEAEFAKKNLPFTFDSTDSAFTLTVTDASEWAIAAAEDFQGTAEVTTAAVSAVNDTAQIKDLARQCAAGKGFNYLAEDGKEIYPGFPEAVAAEKYNVVTLRWATPRKASKTRDEVVSQLLHIAIPSDNTSLLQSISAILANKLSKGGGSY